MNMKRYANLVGIIIMIGFFCPKNSIAQKLFTLEDLNFGGKNYYKMTPQRRYLTFWGDKVVRQGFDVCKLIDLKTGKEFTLFTLGEINAWAELPIDDQPKIRNLYYVSFPFADKSIVEVSNGKSIYMIDFKAHRIIDTIELQKEAQVRKFNIQSHSTAYVQDNQLYVIDPSGAEHKLTKDGSSNIVYGQSVHRDEFGINGGLYWSPKGNRLAFYRMDQSMVANYPLVDVPEIGYVPTNGETKAAKVSLIKYPMVGEKSHKVTVGVYDINTDKTIYLHTGNPTDRYFTNITWSPDENIIYMFELNRDQNDCYLTAYNAYTGKKIANLYHEKDTKYVEPTHPIVFLPWNDHQFVMYSQKDGYNHLYLFSEDGRELKQLTKGKWVVMKIIGFNLKKKSIIYTSNECNPIQINTWMVNVETGKRRLLDNGKGYHNPLLSPEGNTIIDVYSEPNLPRQYDLITLGNKINTLHYFTSPNPWKGYSVPEYSCGKIKASDGKTDLYYRMVKPINFNPAKKYPVIVYVYGGPHAHNVDARWNYGSRGWETYMAQKGYLLFILDNRGSDNRGKEFEQVTFRNLGQEEMKDQMEGIKYLYTLSYVDKDRIGIHGWSFGGFMTISLMTNYPDVFKVGVAGGPVIDWKWYEIMYGERYMDTPKANPIGYAKTSLLQKAKDLKGKLQIVIGLNDPVVVPQHAYSFLKACILAGTQPDFFVYPGEPHNMRGHQSVHLHERITQYFEDYLKPLGHNK
ncbi:DPP IV N-terminal domain-containing protein [Prevotella amnii]|uniref:S9 family peptidase n=1 Tax=Prevotella amnii TaxID=419005 RepID=UPI003369FEAC